MTLTLENMLTRKDVIWSPTLNIDIYRMDRPQLENYIAANFLDYRFNFFENIAFLPESARLPDAQRDLGDKMGALFLYVNKPERAAKFYKDTKLPKPFETYIDPEFRNRLKGIFADYFEDVLEGRDILRRCGHTPESPYKRRDNVPVSETELENVRLNILQGFIDAVNVIIFQQGAGIFEPQLPDIAESKGIGRIIELIDALKTDISFKTLALAAKPDTKLLSLIGQLNEHPHYGNRLFFGRLIPIYIELAKQLS